MPTTPLAENPFLCRDDVARAVGDLFAPLLSHFSASGARVRLSPTAAHFDMAAAEMEGFARPLWGLAPLVAGGGAFAHWELYRSGLAAGTDPAHPDYWGDIAGTDQRQVELAAIAFAMLLVPQHIWEPLDAAAKGNVIAYFQMARAHRFVDSNWHFFRVLIDLALSRCGAAPDPGDASAPLDRLESFYIGDGWYRDGATRCADHYIPFAFHFYGLVYAVLAGDTERAARYRARAAEFARSFRHWCAPDGAILPFGRSLTYRFAIAGFWGALAYADVEALPWGEIKGYYLRNLRWWARQPIFDRDGVLSIGFAYPNLMLSEGYNSAGSPYWAMKAFLPLALCPDHPFWAAHETTPEPATAPVPLAAPGMVVQHLPGHVVALSTGQQNREWRGLVEKYGKFAYSSRYGFSVEADDRHFDKAASDGMLSFSEDGMHVRMREVNGSAEIAGDRLRAVWHPYDDVRVETFLIPAGDWHIRLHEVTTPRRLATAEGGFAIAKPDHRAWTEIIAGARAELATTSDVSVIVGNDARAGCIVSPLSNTNIMSPRTLVPQLRGTLEPGTTLLGCAVLARPRAPGIALPPVPAFPDIDDLRRFFAENGRTVPVFADPRRDPS
ncbi:MAG: DUF2264 domain-containing protein [Alphaproteobacteria bacterium]|nr:DUF2264 domain-containing protein [Alphaproteobacteria bacterium]